MYFKPFPTLNVLPIAPCWPVRQSNFICLTANFDQTLCAVLGMVPNQSCLKALRPKSCVTGNINPYPCSVHLIEIEIVKLIGGWLDGKVLPT